MAIDRRSLQLGDILITVADNAVSHCGLVAGTVRVNTAAGYVDRPEVVLHATGSGIKRDGITAWINERGISGVFRLRSLRYLTVGGVKVGELIAKTADQLAARCAYSKPRAYFLSWTGTSTYGSNAQSRVAKYLARLGTGGQFITTVYCSEFVILSYQLAAKADENADFFIDLDGKHSLPKDLRNWLLAHTKVGGKWLFMGDLT